MYFLYFLISYSLHDYLSILQPIFYNEAILMIKNICDSISYEIVVIQKDLINILGDKNTFFILIFVIYSTFKPL